LQCDQIACDFGHDASRSSILFRFFNTSCPPFLRTRSDQKSVQIHANATIGQAEKLWDHIAMKSNPSVLKCEYIIIGVLSSRLSFLWYALLVVDIRESAKKAGNLRLLFGVQCQLRFKACQSSQVKSMYCRRIQQSPIFTDEDEMSFREECDCQSSDKLRIVDWIKEQLCEEPKMCDLIIILEYISQVMLKQRYCPKMRPSRECKRRKAKAIGWLQQYDNDARAILQTIYLPHLISNPMKYVREDLKARCQYDRWV
jgi:hypothetical protein